MRPGYGAGEQIVLPERVRVIALHRPYAGLIAAGIKTLETRGRPWPKAYGASWLAIYAAAKVDREAMKRLGALAVENLGPAQAMVCLVWVKGSRPLVPEDEAAACFYAPGRWAWELGEVVRFAHPVPLAETGLRAGPQSIVTVRREVIERALCR
jgi:predicted transcriptional regulator